MKLNELLAEAAKDTDIADASEMAAYVDKKLTAAERRELFPVLLREHVIKWWSQERMGYLGHEAGDNQQASAGVAHTTKPYLGKRMPAIREWATELRTRITVDGVGKMFGDCTAVDLRWLAQERRSRATQLIGNAERYENLATELDRVGVKTLNELNQL